MYARRLARLREWFRRRARRASEPHGLVLMYHRVAPPAADPWRLCVSPSNFSSQVEVLTRDFDIVPLSALRDSLRRGRRARPVVAITFDDGYADNLVTARPILERHAAPATVFVSTGSVGRRQGYWWDRLAAIVLGGPALPADLRIRIGRDDFTASDPALARPGAGGDRARRQLHDRLWQLLGDCGDPEREAALGRLAAWAGHEENPDPADWPLDETQLRELTAGGLIDVGAHSVNHTMLSRLPTERKRFEIEQSRAECRRIVGRDPACFSYPHGDHDPESLALVRDAGFSLACTSHADLVWQSGDAYATPRLFVGNEPGAALVRRLQWLWLA